MHPLKNLLALATLGLVCLVATGCNSGDGGGGVGTGGNPDLSAPGPIDGNYTFTAWTCGTKDILAYLTTNAGLTSATINVNRATAALTVNVTGACAITNAFTANYPTASSFAITKGATTCSGSCSGAQCTASGAPSPAQVQTWPYVKAGNTLTVSRLLAAGDVTADTLLQAVGCVAGETESATVTK